MLGRAGRVTSSEVWIVVDAAEIARALRGWRSRHSRRRLARWPRGGWTGALAAGLVGLAAAAAGAESGVKQAEQLVALPTRSPDEPWPTDRWSQALPGPAVDRAALMLAIDALFEPVGRAGVPDTRALVIVQDGAIVTERYAAGFDRESRFHSWSMAKSVTQALAGILVRDGRLALHEPIGIEAWRQDGDPRAALTLDQLLHMTTGLDNDDGLDEESVPKVAYMMFGAGARDQAAHAALPALTREPDTHWAYSTASSTIVARRIGDIVGGGRRGMLAFIRRELLDRIGMRSGVPEFDAAGTFLGGGFFWATARDWARFGYLYLNDGIWEDARVLPEGWVDYARTQGPAPNSGGFGAHFWLNLEPSEHQFELLPGGPRSAFAAEGAAGQYVLILPDRNLVLVRLGELQSFTWEGLSRRIAAVVAAFPALGESRE
jgi:CubicO group peptidase (beta-lactamase class C family)